MIAWRSLARISMPIPAYTQPKYIFIKHVSEQSSIDTGRQTDIIHSGRGRQTPESYIDRVITSLPRSHTPRGNEGKLDLRPYTMSYVSSANTSLVQYLIASGCIHSLFF